MTRMNVEQWQRQKIVLSVDMQHVRVGEKIPETFEIKLWLQINTILGSFCHFSLQLERILYFGEDFNMI